MAVANTDAHSSSIVDVVICGGGLAGLTLARQLRRAHPDLGLVVIERTARPLPEAAHKVGESSVELASQYFERLGLRDYLLDRHLIKHGLRFFPGGGHLPLIERTEVGPAQEPIVSSYQLDRGRIENDLRDMIVEDGAVLIEGAKVSKIDIGPGETPHRIAFTVGEEERELTAKWVVDATGRSALIRRDQKLTRGTHHDANAGWYRVKGKVDITTFVPKTETAWHEAEWAPHRWRSTNHLMGKGYWAWIIPLSSGNTSIGLVVHDAVHGFESVRSLEKMQAFLYEHEPVMAKALEAFEVLDYGCLRGYSHNIARGWSADRWALVGEAGAFVDPLYSPGSDFIAFANSFTEEMIRVDRAGGDLEARSRELNILYRSLVNGNVDLFRGAADIYGHASAMLTKVYWDNFSYWSYPCQIFLQGMFRLTGDELAKVIPIGQRFVQLSQYVQKILAAWAKLAPEEPVPGFRGMPAFPSVLIDAHLALRDKRTPDETVAYMQSRLVEGEEIVAEIVLRVLDAVGEDKLDALVEEAGVKEFVLSIPEERLDAVGSIGLARRKVLRPLAKDVERTLGKPAGNLSRESFVRVLGHVIKAAPAQMQGESAQ